MALRRTGDKPVFEPIMAKFTDAYIGHSAWYVETWDTWFINPITPTPCGQQCVVK